MSAPITPSTAAQAFFAAIARPAAADAPSLERILMPAASVVLRLGERMLVMSGREYASWLPGALDTAGVREFVERPLTVSLSQFRNVAALVVVTKAYANGRLFEEGFGCLHMVRLEDEWWISSIAFELSESTGS